jgi:CRISPR/Cas system-associated exonuclease Cas4 (RecB family)
VRSERGELIYVSPEGLKSFIVREPLTEREVIELIKDGKSPKWPEWECQYCPYRQFCNRANCRHRK